MEYLSVIELQCAQLNMETLIHSYNLKVGTDTSGVVLRILYYSWRFWFILATQNL